MRILHTAEFYYPSVGGAQEVVRQVSEQLAARGHDVTVATSAMPGCPDAILNGVTIKRFAISGNAVRGFHGDVSDYQSFLRTGAFDVMLNYAAQQWTTDLALPLVERLSYPAILAPCGFSGLFQRAYRSYFESLRSALLRYRALVLHSLTYRDALYLRDHRIDHVVLIPNGASASEFTEIDRCTFRERLGLEQETPLLLSVGSHTPLKGHRLLFSTLARIETHPVVLVLVGNSVKRGCTLECTGNAARVGFTSRGRKRAHVLDLPRRELLQAYGAADLFVSSSRIECSPLVLFEAAAAGLPFVTLPAGNAPEIVEWTQGGVVVPARSNSTGMLSANSKAYARVVDELLANPGKRASLGRAGRAAWQRRFRWDTIALEYERLYQSVAS